MEVAGTQSAIDVFRSFLATFGCPHVVLGQDLQLTSDSEIKVSGGPRLWISDPKHTSIAGWIISWKIPI